MAGRGTDIKLGGNKDFEEEGKKMILIKSKKMKQKSKNWVVCI